MVPLLAEEGAAAVVDSVVVMSVVAVAVAVAKAMTRPYLVVVQVVKVTMIGPVAVVVTEELAGEELVVVDIIIQLTVLILQVYQAVPVEMGQIHIQYQVQPQVLVVMVDPVNTLVQVAAAAVPGVHLGAWVGMEWVAVQVAGHRATVRVRYTEMRM
jgi:hypothetical protein